MIKRDEYLRKIITYKDKELIKIITGMRRSGKSFLLNKIYYNYLINSGIKQNHIIKVNLESHAFKALRNENKLYDYIVSNIYDNKKYYVFIDEVQLIDNFEDVLNGLINDYNVDLYITGSNSKLLSTEINTKLRGRGIEIKIFPLSFKEFYSYYGGDKESVFNEYIRYGGLPYLTQLNNEEEKIEYLKMINETIAYKDIIERFNIRNIGIFDLLINLIYSQIGSIVSSNKITNTLKSNNYKTINHETVSNYLKYLSDGFLFYKVNRYDIKGKEYLKTLYKYYAVDIGLRNQKMNFNQMEIGHVIENIVYFELLRRGYMVNVGKNENKEIDFVVKHNQTISYIQVASTIENKDTLKREIGALKGLDDGYEKIIITMDKTVFGHLDNGYKVINIFDFLLE